MKRYPLFAGVGVEIEYMIVDTARYAVRPVAAELLKAAEGKGSFVTDVVCGSIDWSNEFVAHLIEMKTPLPEAALGKVAADFAASVVKANELLAPMNAALMGGGAHPFMNPEADTVIWPHEGKDIYDAYDRIFNARQHGYANVQSVHLNYPFDSDDAFGRLHAALRLVAPLVPAVAAASPVIDGTLSGARDARLIAYMKNALAVPLMTGATIPEPLFAPDDYRRTILEPLYDAMKPLDTDGVLGAGEWLNARGAIPRFDRSAVELRLVDTQECPQMDMGVAALITGLLKMMVEERWVAYATQRRVGTGRLRELLLATIDRGEEAIIDDRAYLGLFGLEGASVTAGGLWRRLAPHALDAFPVADEIVTAAETILDRGTLSTRMVAFLNGDLRRERLVEMCALMSAALAEGRPFEG